MIRIGIGANGTEVRAIQTTLAAHGYEPGPVDGIYGRKTGAAVARLHAMHGSRADWSYHALRDTVDLARETDAIAVEWCKGHGVTHPGVIAFVATMRHDLEGIEDPQAAVAHVARQAVKRRIVETSDNRGPWVDAIVWIGGGNPLTRPHWCGYFTAFCRRVAEHACGDTWSYTTSGGAVRALQRAPASQRVEVPIVGAVYHRTRTKRPASDVDIARKGHGVQGHTGVVIEVLDGGGFVGVGGNSSGAGHSSAGRGGRVALEVLGHGNESARRALERVVGFTIAVRS